MSGDKHLQKRKTNRGKKGVAGLLRTLFASRKTEPGETQAEKQQSENFPREPSPRHGAPPVRSSGPGEAEAVPESPRGGAAPSGRRHRRPGPLSRKRAPSTRSLTAGATEPTPESGAGAPALAPSPSRTGEPSLEPPGGSVAPSARPRGGRRRHHRRGSRRAKPTGATGSGEPAGKVPGIAVADDAATQASLPEANEGRNAAFGGIPLLDSVAAALADMGYQTPTRIQRLAIPPLLAGRDVVGQAITGSGKTAAFGIPICEIVEPRVRQIQAIVLTPTRELAMQVAGELSRIGKRRGVEMTAVYGGQPISRQLRALERGVHVVVGTPGRVMDHMSRGSFSLGNVRIAILDEADRMLDIGFADDMEWILRHTPRSRQTALFSATFPGFVNRLVHRYMDDPVRAQVGAEIQTVDEVEQYYYEVAERDKTEGIAEVLSGLDEGAQVLIFCRMQVSVDRLVGRLTDAGFAVRGLHGGLPQSERNAVMQQFRDGSISILVSTNLAARGIDVPTITHVVNYDMPENVEEYVHRIGRTARMGRKGTAISLVGEWDFDMLQNVASHVGKDRLKARRLGIYS